MQKTLGKFLKREAFASEEGFFCKAWELLQTGPSILRPKRCGSHEPFKLIETVDVKAMLRGAFFTANGRRSLCSVWPPAFRQSQYFNITILLHLRDSETNTGLMVYDWLRDCVPNGTCYMGTPTPVMFKSYIELHQVLNCGAAEQDLPTLCQHRDLLDCFDEAM